MDCIIIYKPKKTKNIPTAKLQNMFKANSDSYGIMYTTDNKLNIIKETGDYKNLYNNLKQIDNNQKIVIHMRTATTGGNPLTGAHPINVNENLAFVHNGNLFEFSQYFDNRKKNQLSDSQNFNKEILQRLPKDFLHDKHTTRILRSYITSNFSKMIFMDNTDNITIFNEKSGIWDDGIWYSNGGIENYGGFGFSGLNYYTLGQIRHKGGIMNGSLFKDKDWKICGLCRGYFKNLGRGGLCRGCRLYLRLLGLTFPLCPLCGTRMLDRGDEFVCRNCFRYKTKLNIQ